MRRSLSALVLGFSLFLGSMSWSGFSITHTVLDPGGSEELADQLFESPALRSALVSVMADRIEGLLPEGIAVSREQLELVAGRTLDDPSVQLLVRQGLVQVHQKALRGDSSPTQLHATAVGTAARTVLVAERPELEERVPQAPAIQVELPTAGLSYLGSIRAGLVQASLIFGLVGAAGACIALLVARNRPMVLRRLAYWAFGTAAFWLVISLAIPLAADVLSPRSGVLAGAIASVMFGAMIPGALSLAGLGLALLVGSFVWRQFGRRRGAHMVGTPIFAR